MALDDQELIATYGTCDECGAPRTSHKFTEEYDDGTQATKTRLLCSKHPITHKALRSDEMHLPPSDPSGTTPNTATEGTQANQT